MIIRSFLTIAASVALMAGSAVAADLTLPSDAVPVVDNGFDWEGAHLGASVSGEFALSDGPSYIGGGVFAGYDFLVSENILLGIGGTVDVRTDGESPYIEAFILGRAGVLVSPDVLLFAIGGVGYGWDFGGEWEESAYQLGAGVEFAVADSVTLRGTVTGYGGFEGEDLFYYARTTVGLAFHF